MDTNQILTLTVFVVVITIVGTIALAAIGYFAFRLRERRNPSRPGIDETMTRPFFFERVRLSGHGQEADAPPAAAPQRPVLEAGEGGASA